jgi:hypothetical protein
MGRLLLLLLLSGSRGMIDYRVSQSHRLARKSHMAATMPPAVVQIGPL